MRPAHPRLWIASELYYPEDTSTGYFLTGLAEGLASEYDVRVICRRPAIAGHDPRVPRRARRGGVDINRMVGTRFAKDRILLRIINLITFSLSAMTFAIFRFRRGDLVLVVTNPPTLPWCMAVAGKLRGARLCLLVHDVYPEVLAATGILRRHWVMYRVLAAIFDDVFRRFDHVIVLGRDMAELCRQKMKGRLSPISIISNWGDVNEIDGTSQDENVIRRELGLDGKFIVQFSGNIGRTHDLASIVSCASALRDHSGIAFLLAGFGGKLAETQQEIAHHGLTNIHVLPRQPRDRLGALLGCSNLTVIAFIGDMFGISVPSRMYNVMAAAVPIAAMADPRSELSLTVAENDAGWVIAEGDVAALTALVVDLASGTGSQSARARGENGRAAVTRDFTLDAVLVQYREVLRRMVAN